MTRRTAFLIANQSFRSDSGLENLRGPFNDVAALNSLLANPECGMFAVNMFVNSTSFDIKSAIDEELGRAGPGDMVLIYYTGHGKLDRSGSLCLATADTKSSALQATSISTRHLREFVDNSDCDSVVLILDCCYSGAAANGSRGDVESQLALLGEASGFFILSASSETQVALESDVGGEVFGDFTTALIKGIRTGEADFDKDGMISLHEIARYTRQSLRRQTPKLFASRAGNDPVVGKVMIAPVPQRDVFGDAVGSAASQSSVRRSRPPRLRVLEKIAHPAQVVDVAFDLDGHKLATVCDDGQVRIFDIPTARQAFDTSPFRQIGRLQARPHSLRSASWSKGGSVIATSDTAGRIVLWRDGGPAGEMSVGSRALRCAQYGPDGQTLVSGSDDGYVSLWQPQKRKLLWRHKFHSDLVSSVSFRADGRQIVTSSYDGNAVVIDRASGVEISRFSRKSDQFTVSYFVSSEHTEELSCVSAGLNGEVFIWPVSGNEESLVTKHKFWVRALAHCDSAGLIISGGYDASIRILDLKSGDSYEGARVDQGPVICIRVSNNEDLLVVSTHDGVVYIIEIG